MGIKFGAGADIFSCELGIELKMVNIYGSWLDRNTFWDRMMAHSYMHVDNLVVRGGLNFFFGDLKFGGLILKMTPYLTISIVFWRIKNCVMWNLSSIIPPREMSELVNQ